MITERDMSCPTFGSRNVTVRLDTEQIRANGDALAPVIEVRPQFVVRTANGTQFAQQELLVSYSAALYPEGKHFPWSQTGMQPFNNDPLFLPINHGHIAAICKQAEAHQEGDIYLTFGFALIASSKLNPDRPVEQLPPWLTHTLESFQIALPASRWQTFLKTWGYPETRLLPVSMALPSPLANASPIANKAWSVATGALLTANAAWREGEWLTAGQELRRATQFALLTWASVWGQDGPAASEDVSKAITFFDQILPKVDPAKSGHWLRGGEKADEHRIYTRYHTLRQFYAMSHCVHHIGERPVYTEGDIDYLLASVVAFCRGLPAFWVEYPHPPAAVTAAKA